MYKTSLDNKTGRFVKGGNLIKLDGVEVGWWDPIRFNQTSSDYSIPITHRLQCRPDIIASIAYGTPQLAWFVLQYNGIVDPFTMVEGVTIRLPSPEYVFANLL